MRLIQCSDHFLHVLALTIVRLKWEVNCASTDVLRVLSLQKVLVFETKLRFYFRLILFDLNSVLVDRLSLLFKVCDDASGFYPVRLVFDEFLRCVEEVINVLDLIR